MNAAQNVVAWLLVILVAGLMMAVIQIACWWRLFEKAGEPGWASIVPFYNGYVWAKISVCNGWLFFLSFIPVAGSIWMIVLTVMLVKAFGRGAGFSVGMILLPVVFWPMLAFGDNDYIGGTHLF